MLTGSNVCKVDVKLKAGVKTFVCVCVWGVLALLEDLNSQTLFQAMRGRLKHLTSLLTFRVYTPQPVV